MKKKFLRGIAAALAVVMMMPTAAWASETAEPAEVAISVTKGDAAKFYDAGEYDELELSIATEGAKADKITWMINQGSSAVSLSAEKGLKVSVIPKNVSEDTDVSIGVVYNGPDGIKTETIDFEVKNRKLEEITVDENNAIVKMYSVDESFYKDGVTVYATYSDDSANPIKLSSSAFDVTPTTFTEAIESQIVKISYTYDGVTKNNETINVTVNEKVVDTVKTVEIITPYDGMEVKKDHVINEIRLLVTWNSGKTETITATKTTADFETSSDYTLGKKITEDTAFYVKYKDVPSAIVNIKVVEEPTTATITNQKDVNGYITCTTSPSDTTYAVGDPFDPTGMAVVLTYSDSSKNYTHTFDKTSFPEIKFTSAHVGTNQTIRINQNILDKYGNTFKIKATGITVTASSTPVVNVVELYDYTSGTYKYALESDAKISIGDTLDWTDIFKYVYIQYKEGSTTKYQKITGNDVLKSFLGDNAKLHLVVSDRYDESDGDTIEASDVKNGKVTLRLYLEYSGNNETYTSTSKSIVFDMNVSDVVATVTIYRNTSSSYTTGISKVFDDLEDALDSLDDEDDVISEYQVSSTYDDTFAVKIKLGDDQDIEGYTFEPDHEHKITIDLNGNKLTLDSDWIEYDSKNEDIEIVITNTNDDDDGTLVYDDLDTSLTVADGSELEFTEGNVPMDSDAAVTLSIYRNATSTSSSYLIKTKVYDDLEDALDDLEKQDDAVETFDIPSSYDDTFAARIKLGEDEDQDITGYTFAPDYDTTVYIDLNGNKLELDSDWIDYDDCEDLVVKINNTHADDKATLVYDDKDLTLAIAKGDTALEFKEDQVPGIYKISLGTMTNGKATMSKDTVAHGGTIKFTITPNSGYAIDTVKVNSKTVSASNYTVDSKGVGTYELKDIVADVKLDVTFKKGSATTETEDNKTSTTDWNNPFTDVSSNAQYYEAVAFVCSEGLFNGMTATKFEPTTTMTRAMFVTVLGRLAGVDVARYSGTSFTDVSKTDQQISWATPYIEWAVQNGITQGTGNGKFSPNDPITHQQMYLFMYRYAMFVENIDTPLTGVSLSSIKDASEIADWAQDGVKFASKNNILITSGGKLTPTDNALRCELAMLLYGFCTKVLGYND